MFPLEGPLGPGWHENTFSFRLTACLRPPTTATRSSRPTATPGGSHAAYREYLDPKYLEDFDAWRSKYKNPYKDLGDNRRLRNWDNEMRNGQQEEDGIVGEVVFPNTVPPFFPSFVLFAKPPTDDEYEHRHAGVQAHNRWLVDWCDEFPERRAGVGQIFLNDVDDAIADVDVDQGARPARRHPAAEHRAGREVGEAALRPLLRPAVGGAARTSRCPVNVHGGTGNPDYGHVPGVDAALHQRGAASTRSARSCRCCCRACSSASRASSS